MELFQQVHLNKPYNNLMKKVNIYEPIRIFYINRKIIKKPEVDHTKNWLIFIKIVVK